MRAAERNPGEVLRYVDDDEAQSRSEAMYGKTYARRGEAPWHVSAEDCAEYDGTHGRPVRELLRSWCGKEAIERWDELAALRAEIMRLDQITSGAIEALRRHGGSQEADRLERELGVPVETLRTE